MDAKELINQVVEGKDPYHVVLAEVKSLKFPTDFDLVKAVPATALFEKPTVKDSRNKPAKVQDLYSTVKTPPKRKLPDGFHNIIIWPTIRFWYEVDRSVTINLWWSDKLESLYGLSGVKSTNKSGPMGGKILVGGTWKQAAPEEYKLEYVTKVSTAAEFKKAIKQYSTMVTKIKAAWAKYIQARTK